MSNPAPEFSRPVRADQIVRHAQGVTITADAHEREALAKRFHLLSLSRLEADYTLSENDSGIEARGRVRAELAQPCVATGVAVPEKIDTEFLLRFVAERGDEGDDEEMEIDSEDCDIIGFDGQTIDMGEAVAETMALAMAPYPRSADADSYLREAGVLSEEQASPFAVLQSLKDKKS